LAAKIAKARKLEPVPMNEKIRNAAATACSGCASAKANTAPA
jgi:hypothetical protein